jgi:RNA polymerase sigma-70 factor (ECF subfamily)
MADLEHLSDESLMVRLQGGDRQAFSFLVRRHTDRFFACAYRIAGRTQEAEDIVQDAFVKLWQKPNMWDSDKGVKFTTWFYRVVTNTALDHLRQRKGVKNVGDGLDSLASEYASPEQELQQKQQQAHLELAIQALPERQKAALNLCFYEGLSNQEASEIMGVKPKALESLLMRAKEGVRNHLIRAGVINPAMIVETTRRHSYG